MLHAREDYNNGKLDSIPKEEPVFLLRAQDRIASATLRYWASLQRDEELKTMALKHADLMDTWPIRKKAVQ